MDVAVDLRKILKHLENITQLLYRINLNFLFLFLKVLLMVFCVYPKDVQYIINVPSIDIRRVKER